MRTTFVVGLLGLLNVAEARRRNTVVGTPFVGEHADADFIVSEDRSTTRLSQVASSDLRSTRVNSEFKTTS